MNTVRLMGAATLAFGLIAGTAAGAGSQFSSGGGWSTGGQNSWQSTGAPPPQYTPPRHRTRSWPEVSALYAVGTAYGVGMGIWVSSELEVRVGNDPAILLIPPVVLGLAAPTGVFFLDRPRMPEGLPAAMAAGLILGAGEGVGVAGNQYAFAKERDEWGFRGLTRATAAGATAGGIAGYAVGYYLEPPPATLALTTSGAAWGMTVGTMVTHGASKTGKNDFAALGGLIGYNVGMAGMAALGMATVPKWYHLGWMWGGAGVGAAASLPIYLFYVGDKTPEMRRGLIFTGTAITLGVAGGALLSGAFGGMASGSSYEHTAQADHEPWITVDGIGPLATKDGFGLQAFGRLF